MNENETTDMKRRSLGMVAGGLLATAASFGALIVMIPSVVEAEPLVRKHYDETFTEPFTDTTCGDAITIDYTIHFTGLLMIKPGRAGDPKPYFFENYSEVETFTNVANGLTVTITHQGLFKNLRVEHLEGTIIKITSIETGRQWAIFGPDGEKLMFDAGLIRYTQYFDTLGDGDPENDVFLGEDPLSFAGPHPARAGSIDILFCDLLDLLR